MRYQDKLYEGLAIYIIIHDGEYKGKYRSRIEEIGVRIITVGVPVAKAGFIPLREGTILDVAFYDEISAYSFTSMIIDRIVTPVPAIIVEYPTNIRRIQRRQYVRVPVVIPLEYRIAAKEGLSKPYKGHVIDLSGGGILFKVKDNIEEKSIVFIKVNLGGTETELPASIIRCVKEEEQNFYNVSAEFQDITENTRDRIIRYVFEVQREMRKKGLI